MFNEEDINKIQQYEAMGDFLKKELIIEKEKLWEKIYNENIKLIYHMHKKYKDPFLEYDDFIFAYDISLVKAVKTFDLESHTKFSTYMFRIMFNEIMMLKRNSKKYTKDIVESELNMYIRDKTDYSKNIDSFVDLIGNDPEDIVDNVFRKIEINKMFENFDEIIFNSSNLSMREKIILTEWLKGKHQKEISNSCNISRSYVSRIIKKINAGMLNAKKYRNLRKSYTNFYSMYENKFNKLLNEIDPYGLL